MITDAEIGYAVRRLRKDAGMSIAELAPHAGIDKHALLRREHGRCPMSAAELFSICTALGVRPRCVLDLALARRRGRAPAIESPVAELRREVERLRGELEQGRASPPPVPKPRRARRAGPDRVPSLASHPIRLRDRVIQDVLAGTSIRVEQLFDGSRDAVGARHACWYLLRELAGLSYPQIADLFGCDHSTVQYALRRALTQPDPRAWIDAVLSRPATDSRAA
jgi:transcriptional regulator with XRE-family HTH domain